MAGQGAGDPEQWGIGEDDELSCRGQIAQVDDVAAGKSETFQWDGLALIQRNEVNYVNEPAITGGNPIVADGKALFDDMLGSTLGVVKANGFEAIDRTAFGETKSNSDFNFFTGKPEIEGLGYNFLLRNYQAGNGKWQTSDPMGYPDGWNNLAYVNNGVTSAIDWLGGLNINVYPQGQDIYWNAEKIPNSIEQYSVGGHGNSNGIYVRNISNNTWDLMDPVTLANRIKEDPAYTGQDVYLYSCNVGTGDYGQQLANELNGNVYAPNSYVWIDEDGGVYIGGLIENPDSPTNPYPDYNDPGEFVKFVHE